MAAVTRTRTSRCISYARAEIPNFIEQKRAEGLGVDAKLLLFLNF